MKEDLGADMRPYRSSAPATLGDLQLRAVNDCPSAHAGAGVDEHDVAGHPVGSSDPDPIFVQVLHMGQ